VLISKDMEVVGLGGWASRSGRPVAGSARGREADESARKCGWIL